MDANVESDHRRRNITVPVIDGPANLPEGRIPPESSNVERNGAARTGNLLIVVGNQVWDVLQAIEYVMVLAVINPRLPRSLTSTFSFISSPSFHSILFFPIPFIT